MKIAFFSSKQYDEQSFTRVNSGPTYDLVFFEAPLNTNAVALAQGYPVQMGMGVSLGSQPQKLFADSDFISLFMLSLPFLVILLGMIGLKWSALKAGSMALLVTLGSVPRFFSLFMNERAWWSVLMFDNLGSRST